MKNKLLGFAVFFLMFTLAMNDSVKGILLPFIEKDFGVGTTESALVISISYGATLLFTFLNGYIGRYFKKTTLLIGGLSIMVLSIVAMCSFNNYYLFLVGMFILSGFSSLINLQLNLLTPKMFLAYQGIMMSLIHFSYGVGMTLAQNTTGKILSQNSNWRVVYIIIILLLLFAILAVFIFRGSFNVSKDEIKEHNDVGRNLRIDKKLICFVMIFGMYFIAEHGTMNWIVSYSLQGRGFTIEKSTFISSIFFGLLTFGRLFGGILVDKINKYKLVIILSSLAFISYLSGMILGENLFILVSVSGLFFSIIYPTMIIIVTENFSIIKDRALSMIISIATIFDIVFNTLFGKVTEIIGYNISFWIIPISLGVMVLFTYNLKRISKKG